MGGSCASNRVPQESNYSIEAPKIAGSGMVRVLIVALDYECCSRPGVHSNVEVPVLSCPEDATHFEKFVTACGVEDVTKLLNEQCTTINVKMTLREVASRCGENDFFVFYFSGHGDLVANSNLDEESGKDSAYVLLAADGSCQSPTTYFIDDEFASILTHSLNPKARAIILSDCCHSGSIADLTSACWQESGLTNVISISGCGDSQESCDTGHGGVLTGSMLLAAATLRKAGIDAYSVGKLFNLTVKMDAEVFHSSMDGQDFAIQCVPGLEPDQMAWPLLLGKHSRYKAPFGTGAQAASALTACLTKLSS